MKNTNPKILSIDPGTTCLGWAISEYIADKQIMKILKYGHFEPSYTAKKDKINCEKYTQQIISLEVIEKEIYQLLIENDPDYVVTEDAFIHPKRINAYIALRLCIHTIARMCKLKGLGLFKIATRKAKKTVSGTGAADKITIQESILNHTDIIFKISKQIVLEKMIEHEADAIAVGYDFIKNTLIFIQHE